MKNLIRKIYRCILLSLFFVVLVFFHSVNYGYAQKPKGWESAASAKLDYWVKKLSLPKGYLKGCEELVQNYQIGTTYTDYDDLKKKLLNEDLVKYYKKNAIKRSKYFLLENNFETIDRFLKKMLDV